MIMETMLLRLKEKLNCAENINDSNDGSLDGDLSLILQDIKNLTINLEEIIFENKTTVNFNDISSFEYQLKLLLDEEAQFHSDREKISLKVNYNNELYSISAICVEEFCSMGWCCKEVLKIKNK